MDANEVRGQVSKLSDRLDESDDPHEWRQLARELIPLMVAYWDVHPHSAMEMLEHFAMRFPLSLAPAFVCKVVLGWRAKESYDPHAGGNADYCYLSALILSDNFDLAEHPWVDHILSGTLEKELKYPRFDRMRDGRRKKAFVQEISASPGP